MTVARIKHIRTAGYCSSGARRWFQQQGLSWQDFLANGLPVEFLDTLDDHMANEVARIAREDANHGGQ